jgi:hypothetical protein
MVGHRPSIGLKHAVNGWRKRKTGGGGGGVIPGPFCAQSARTRCGTVAKRNIEDKTPNHQNLPNDHYICAIPANESPRRPYW